MLVLGIETSCDETAAAVVKDGRELLSNIIASQVDIHSLYGGVVPEIASRAHTEAIYGVVEKALDKASVTLSDIGAIAVTYSPGLIGALLTGLSFAKGLSFASGIPLVPVHHIRGHVAANFLAFKELEPPFIALVVSGGHTSLLKVLTYTDYESIGHTRDDAAGEAFDKAARVLGLPYPGGVSMDRMASKGDKTAVKFTVSSVDNAEYDFSFSGLKTAVINLVHNHTEKNKGVEPDEAFKADIAASYTDALVRTITSRLRILLERDSTLPIVMAGGVAANTHLRRAVGELADSFGVGLFMPPLSLCGDNAAMIASQGFFELISGVTAPLSQNAFATKSV
ncbi:MAG: tRNA (adenosine(37)-N6)-threonylcarbamoyltransferase complex transferase subunit TsaD [Firmicutes bacterium HGW-Firmicutes-21]|nr:MAG: tRNA (adenosine(37)-N6)-threonylcarbamoyltransferase complex transferase subunit TsaD [Firmicutes bacterium HGW-Firmicutes-21]